MQNRISKYVATFGCALTVAFISVARHKSADAAVITSINPTLDLYIDPVESRSSVGQSGDVYNTNTANDIGVDSGILLMGNSGGNRDRRAFLKFDLSSLNIDTVVSASLQLNLEDLGSNDQYGNAQLRRIGLSDWNSSTVTYAHGSNATSNLIDTFAVATGPSPGIYTIDVTSTVQGWADGSFSNFGFGLKQSSEGYDGTARQFTSTAGIESLRPLLTIEYELPPAPEPTTLTLLILGMCGLIRSSVKRKREEKWGRSTISFLRSLRRAETQFGVSIAGAVMASDARSRSRVGSEVFPPVPEVTMIGF
jgi:hypothetical protein